MIPTIGLEIHVELKTRSKMFCSCLNDLDERHPNTNVCPVCLGHPGVLPTANKEAIRKVILAGLALNGGIPSESKFDRKNYFYPDLPKGYQISQYDRPLVEGGLLAGIRIRRIHLEEDTGRLAHVPDKKYSLVDFNRAGIPLMELVTEPDIKSAEEAVSFAKELQLILRYLDISYADMEKGQLRIEANISLRPEIQNELGTKIEIKNLNSFKAVQEAIAYEIKRQEELLKEGKKVVQETRGWNENKKKTISQRLKEEAHDYRYFPEPDLPSFEAGRMFNLEELRVEVPELPEKKRQRFVQEYGLSGEDAAFLAGDRRRAAYFEEAASEFGGVGEELTVLFNYFVSDLKGLMNDRAVGFDELKISPRDFASLIKMINKEDLSSRMAKDVLAQMFDTGNDPEEIIRGLGLSQIKDEEQLKNIVEKIIEENPKVAEDYRKGKTAVIQFLIGQAMKKTKGTANPEVLKRLFEQEFKML